MKTKTGSTAGGMVTETNIQTPMNEKAAHIRAAIRMVELFASVGAEHFELTHTNLDQEPRGCRHGQSTEQIKISLPYLIPSSFRRENNVILRPHNSSRAAFIQLDDLNAESVERVKPAAFMVIETSPANFQVWLAVEGAGKAEARRLRKGSGADEAASGATRVAGSANHKRKYAPEFPIVKVTHAQAGRMTTLEELDTLGLLAPVYPPKAPPTLPRAGRIGRWPSYAKCLSGAPMTTERGQETARHDISKADFTFALIALDWGHSPEETADRLMQESDKAKENGPRYAEITARNAAAALAQRAQRPNGP